MTSHSFVKSFQSKMYPRPALNEFFPKHLRSLMGAIECRVAPNPDEGRPFRAVTSRYSIFDMTTRLPVLIRNDPQICAYLLWCIDRFEERKLPQVLFGNPPEELERVNREIVELRAFLKMRKRMAMRPARM